MSTHIKVRFELTEWAADEETQVRHIDLESSSVAALRTRLDVTGAGLTAAELAAVQKIIDGMNDLHRLHPDTL